MLRRSPPNSQRRSASTPDSLWRPVWAARSLSTVFDPALAVLAGTHRVQRVPATEKRGRRHSSIVTVVVFDDIDPRHAATLVRREDVRVDIFRASGPGGQHRNKVETAVRLTHIPTGTVVTATEERSQHQNRAVAWDRLYLTLAARDETASRAGINATRRDTFDQGRSWTWTSWRDEVKSPDGRRASMGKALSGRWGRLLD